MKYDYPAVKSTHRHCDHKSVTKPLLENFWTDLIDNNVNNEHLSFERDLCDLWPAGKNYLKRRNKSEK